MRPSEQGGEARGESGVLVCGAHRNTVTVDDVLSDDAWDRVGEGMEAGGYARPVKRLTSLEFEALQ
jgi:hypothetical protein